MEVHFLNVGHGDMSVVKINDKTILIDINVSDENESLDYLEKTCPSKEIDYLIITHLHEDHIRGFQKLLEEGYSFKKIFDSGYRYPNTEEYKDKRNEEPYASVAKYLDKNEDKNVLVLSPSDEKINDEDDFDIFCYNAKTDVTEEIHYSSLVIKICENGKSVLFTGDSDMKAWKDKICKTYTKELSSDILHASHHGSRTFFKVSEEDECFRTHIKSIAPVYTVISAPNNEDKREDWPPHDDAVEEYTKYTSVDGGVYITGASDTLVFNLDKDGIETADLENASKSIKFHEGKSNENSLRQVNDFALSPYMSNPLRTIFNVSHRKKPQWQIFSKGNVTLQATYKTKRGRTKSYKNNGSPIPKNAIITFTAKTDILPPYDIQWQILNTGKEAETRGTNALRGDFYPSTGDNRREEPTAYKGKHMAQAYVIKDGICEAKSEEFIVNIQ